MTVVVPMKAPQSDLVSREEAAAFLRLKKHTLEAWASSGRYDLPFVKVGHLARYRRSDLEAFIERRTVCGKRAA